MAYLLLWVVNYFSVFFVDREKGVNKKRTLCRFPKMLTIMNDPYLEYIYILHIL